MRNRMISYTALEEAGSNVVGKMFCGFCLPVRVSGWVWG